MQRFPQETFYKGKTVGDVRSCLIIQRQHELALSLGTCIRRVGIDGEIEALHGGRFRKQRKDMVRPPGVNRIKGASRPQSVEERLRRILSPLRCIFYLPCGNFLGN